jgi:type II secretory pathway pseudopilin PulG
MKQIHQPILSPPQASPPRVHAHAFSTTELLVTIAITGILLSVTAVAIARAQKLRSQTVCAANLRSIGIAFQSYLMDNGGRYPQPSTGAQWEDLLRTYLHRPSFNCPGDEELYPALGSSYDWRDTADPTISLAGKRTIDINRGNVSLSYDALPGWHAPGKLQLVTTEGAVRLVEEDKFLADLQLPISSSK